MDKDYIRRQVKSIRHNLKYDEVIFMSEKINSFFLESNLYKSSNKIMTYVSFENEVDTHNLINRMIDNKKTVSVPLILKTNSKTNDYIVSIVINSFNELQIGTYNIYEPKYKDTCITDISDLDIIIVPGIAFDRNFNRIGFGGGFYDRFLSSKPNSALKVAFAYSFQVFDKIPSESFDINLDVIITEKEIISKMEV